MAYNRKDRYFKKAKEDGFRSRAAYKLVEMNQKFQLLKPGMTVVDLGCAPGSWVQVIAEKIGPQGKVIGLDLEAIPGIPTRNTTFIQGDIRESSSKEKILSLLGQKADLVVSDMSPHLSGVKFRDHYNSYELDLHALELARSILKNGGVFVAKIFPGEELELFKQELRKSFSPIKTFIPEATRKTSTEVYLVAKSFHL